MIALRRAVGRARQRLDAMTPWQTSALVAVALLGVFLPTATYDAGQSPDPLAAARAARQVAVHGTLALDVEPLHPWYVDVGGRVVTDRQPGVIAFGVPFAWVLRGAGTMWLVAAGVAGSVAAALAMTALHLAFRALVPPATAVVAALVGGLATATWSISADALWPHGPGQLWLALSLLALAGERFAPAGTAYALAICTRAPTAVVALVVGLHNGLRRRSLRPVAAVGIPSALGLAALLAYNARVFGAPSLSGGYPDSFAESLRHSSLRFYLDNVAGTLLSPDRGVLVLSAFVLLLLPGLPRAWRAAPTWVRSGALGGAAYLLLHLRLNRFWGGHNFFGYRYPLEALTLAAPLLLLCWREWTSRTGPRRVLFTALVALGVGVHALGATVWDPPFARRSPWTNCNVCESVTEAPVLALLTATAVVVVTAVAVLWERDRERPPARERQGR